MKNIIFNAKAVQFFLISILVVLSDFQLTAQNTSDLKLRNYRPVSIYNIPKTFIQKPKYTAIDAHIHPVRNEKAMEECIRVMDACGIDKAYIMTGATGERYDAIVKSYAKYANRFEFWCGFDYKGYDEPDFGKAAVTELERCVKNGAKGVGELMFKGKGTRESKAGNSILVPDDPRLDALYIKCAELKIPINIHVSEDKWMYEKGDSTNDGLMNASTWQIKMENGAKTHEELLTMFENTLKKHPKTIFIAAHYLNCCADLSVLARYFDKYPNLYADICARFGETAPIPRYMHDFIEKYQNRLIYASDMNTMYEPNYTTSYRILETADEHFYDFFWSPYHWALNGFALSNRTLKKLYSGNVIKVMKIR